MRSLGVIVVLAAGCDRSALPSTDGGGDAADLARAFADLAASADDFGGCAQPNACGDCLPGCMTFGFDPSAGRPFPLTADHDSREFDQGIVRTPQGWLFVSGLPCGPPPVGWIANASDWNRGTVSRMEAKTNRETARYFSVTCGSLPSGSTAPCDGKSGCCAGDDQPRFAARRALKQEPPREAIQLMANSPSRTGVDFNGDLWVANRAPGGQASLTKIASLQTECVDRDHDGAIETSSDVDGDGLIETDCNGDGQPDDIASVKAKPCTNGMAQEFFGLDDECVLATLHLGDPNDEVRAVALGPGTIDFGPSDVWAGGVASGKVRHVDGTKLLLVDELALPLGCAPDGMVIDPDATAWTATSGGGPLCFFDAKSGAGVGTARAPMGATVHGRVVDLDRDSNIWLADAAATGAWRFTPNRKGAFADLGDGLWTHLVNAGAVAGAKGLGRAIALDSRTANSYFGWLVTDGGSLVAIPASTIAIPKVDTVVDGSAWPAFALPGFDLRALDVTSQGNLVLASGSPSATIEVLVDGLGVAQPPDLQSPALPNQRCPAGARCLLADRPGHDPGTDAYSDMAVFGLRNFCLPKGVYRYVVTGCAPPSVTHWSKVAWESDTPLNTEVTAKARTGLTAMPDPSWSDWTPIQQTSPLDPGASGVPNNQIGSSMQVEFDLGTSDKSQLPRLRSFAVAYRCQ